MRNKSYCSPAVIALVLGTSAAGARTCWRCTRPRYRATRRARGEANRLAAARGQAPGARLLLPQISLGGQVYKGGQLEGESYFRRSTSTTGRGHLGRNRNETTRLVLGLHAQVTRRSSAGTVAELRRGQLEVALAEANTGAAQQDLNGPRLERATSTVLAAGGHALSRGGHPAGLQPPARTVREALRGRPDRDHRRAGIEGRVRQRDGRRDCAKRALATAQELLRRDLPARCTRPSPRPPRTCRSASPSRPTRTPGSPRRWSRTST